MLITSLSHAGLRVDTEKFNLLMDPWLATTGAFQGAWHQFPSNAHLDTPALLDVDWVTVSHEHLDHMDLSVLSRLPRRTRVLIPQYPSKNFLRRLQDGGVANVFEVAAWQRFPLNTAGDWLTFIPEQSPMCHDAGVLVCADGASLLHCNDARLSVAQGRRATVEAGGSLDVMAVQMSGASWHPICYEYPTEVAERIETEKRIGKFKAVTRLLRGVGPRLAVPFAGPPCFLDPVVRHHNPSSQRPGIFPNLEDAVGWLSERLTGVPSMYWLPGDTYQVASGRLEREPRWEGFSFSDTEAYLDSYAEARRPDIEAVYAAHPEPGEDLGERFAEHFARLGELSSYFLERIAMTVRFEVEGRGGGCWDVRFDPDRVRVNLHGGAGEAQYRFRVASRWLEPVIAGRVGWEDLLLSLRFTAWRSPDLYNDYLVGLLKHADADALEAVASYESSRDSNETVMLEDAEGNRYEVGRYCPHAGEDLTHGAVVNDGVLRCLGHNFDFDLASGQCLNARCDALPVRRVQAPV
jgi:nitrite reductase/ring-hydroxylating ferredoxin subunit